MFGLGRRKTFFLFKWTKPTLEIGRALGNVAKAWAITETSSLSESTNKTCKYMAQRDEFWPAGAGC